MLKINLKIIICIIILINAIDLHSHEHFEINGIVLDRNENPVHLAQIKVRKTSLNKFTNKEGKFFFNEIDGGEYRFNISAEGFKYIDTIIKINANTFIKFYLDKNEFKTDNIVVTGNRTETKYSEMPIKISISDAKVFEAAQTVALKDGLKFQPGLRVESNCQNCGYSQIRINGLDGRYSQILINSKPIFTSLNSMYGLDQIPINMIDRIEVIKGGGSALFGGNAVAGVINVITKEPSINNFNVAINNFTINPNSLDNSIQFSTGYLNNQADIGLFAFGNLRDKNSWDLNADGFSESPLSRNYSLGINSYYMPENKSKLNFELYFINEYRRGGDNLNLAPHLTMMAEDITHNLITGSIGYEKYFNNNKLNAYAAVNITRKDNYTGVNKDENGYGNTKSNVINLGLMYNSVLKEFLIGSSVWTNGIELTNDNMISNATGYGFSLNQKVNIIGVYSQMDWILNQSFNLLLGFRLDKHNLVNNLIFNPRLAILYKENENLNFRLNISSGYRAPQAYDDDLHATMRGGNRVLIRISNDLKEEKSNSISLSSDLNYEVFGIKNIFSLEGFYTILENAFINTNVGIDEFGNNIYLKENGNGALVNGITVENDFVINENSKIVFNFTAQNSFFDEDVVWSENINPENNDFYKSNKMFKTPNYYGSMNFSHNFSEYFALNLSMIYTGSMYVPHLAGAEFNGAIVNDELVRTKEFYEINANLRYEIQSLENIVFKIGIINLMNSFQSDFDLGANRDTDFIYGPLRPRTFYIGFEKNFQ